MGIVTEIQRFSLNDGPGIRTAVFLKGCNMRCAWCHNPETLSFEPELMIYPSKCIGCNACTRFDKTRIMEKKPLSREQLTPDSASLCFTGALDVAGREMSADEVMFQIEQDVDYYNESGGGLTLSGGEAMLQPEFVKELLLRCRDAGISVGVETNMSYEWSVLEELLPLMDLVMADIKLLDDARHIEYTGISNARILDNARRLAASGKPFILRTPVVPGVNDNTEDIGAIAAFIASLCAMHSASDSTSLGATESASDSTSHIASLDPSDSVSHSASDSASHGSNLVCYELLNFNPLGASKYEALGHSGSPFRDARPLSAERMQELKTTAEQYGLRVRAV